MPLASLSQRRRAFRELLRRPRITHPGSVFDGVSARLAQQAGYELGLLGGSVASAVVLAAPDLVLLTLSEFADQIRRIARACDLPLMVDADHGYGNALNAMRTVSELEAAGVAALTIEDTLLPRRYGGADGELIPLPEFRDKLRASLAGRSDPELCVIGRTGGLRAGLDECIERVRVCEEAGVDAVFVLGVREVEQIRAVRAATSLPLLLNSPLGSEEELLALGVRIVLQGHQPYYVMLRALYEAYQHLLTGGTASELQQRSLPRDLLEVALREAEHAAWARDFLALD